MMNCTDFQSQIDDYCSDELSSELSAICETHLASCLDCARAVDEHNGLLESLKAMPVTGPSEGFAERALRAAIDQEMAQGAAEQSHHHRRGFMVGFGSAAAAALALWVVGVSPQLNSGDTGTLEMAKVGTEKVRTATNVEANIPEFSIYLNEQRDIKLAFFSSEDLKGATIRLQVPENVALVGYEGQRELAWETNLAKGDNTLRLPIVATSVVTSVTGGQLVAHIEYKGKVKTLKVNLAIGATGGAPELSGNTEFEMRVV